MTVTNTTRNITYTGNGATTDFDFAFPVGSESDVHVYLYTIATETEVELASSAYTLTLETDNVGGQVTYPISGSPIASTHKLTIQRERVATQELAISNQSGFHPEIIEDAFDKLTMLVQEANETVSRTLVLPAASTVTSLQELYDELTDNSGEVATALATTQALIATLPVLEVVGAVVDYAGAAAPTGWLLCYGQAISRTSYAALFTVLGTTWGAGDGSTTFNLPDLRGRVVAGQDDMGGSSANRLTTPLNGDTLGAVDGAESITLAQANLPNATLTGTTAADGNHGHPARYDGTGSSSTGGTGGISMSTGGSLDSPAFTGTLSNTRGEQIGASGTHTHTFTTTSINGNVEQTVVSVLQPTMILNKIIYTGV